MNYRLMKKLILFVGVFVGILSANIANAESPVWGTYKVECPANSDTYIGITTTRAPVFTGKVQSVQNGTTNIVAQGEPNWSANQFVYVAGSQTNHYYLKFTSGELEGAWYDIKSNGAYFAEIEIGSAELAKVKADDTFQIIPHWTLATLFPNGGGFTAGKTIAGSTKLRKYATWTEENGLLIPVGRNNAFSATYYFRKSGTKSAWCNASNKIVDDEVLEPHTFFKVNQPESLGDATVTYNGVIPISKYSLEVFWNEDVDQDIYFTVPTATSMTISEFTESLVNSGVFVSTSSLVAIDRLIIYTNKTPMPKPAPDLICFHRAKGARQMWVTSSGESVDDYELKAGSVIIFRKKATTFDQPKRVSFKPTYVKE